MVRVANTGGFDLDQNLVATWLAYLDRFNRESSCAIGNRSPSFHTPILERSSAVNNLAVT
jgi:hypothetical protein